MNLRHLFKIDLDDPSGSNRELWLKLVALIVRAVAVLVILFVIFRNWAT